MRNDSSHERWLLETFLRETLKFHQIQVVAAVDAPHQVLSPTYFVANRILKKVDGRKRYVAIADDDWSTLTGRVVDYRRGQGQFFSNVLDLKLPQTWAADANVAVLIGGESGSGKTMEMISGHRDKSDLVVYMRGFSGESDVVKFVKYVFYCSCPCMNDVLKRHTNGDKFTVWLCFDDIDDSAALVRACSLDTTKLREMLGWGPSVEIRVAVAGSGIVAACNGSGINRNLYQLETLSHNESMRKAIVYWKIRRHLIKEALHVHCTGKDLNLGELLCDVEMLEIHWGDRQQREAMLRKRSATLSRLFREQLTSLATKMELSFVSTLVSAPDSILTLLTNEAFFAAVESDSACAAALSNPRMAALLVKEVQNIGQRTLTDEIGVATKGINVRRHVSAASSRFQTYLRVGP
ncbi:Hypothetical protein, putative [Bodo saltans]|uniref:Uncharacterized protein n=1 Tax=Bodo saltans TaxID=75058 RepID=A0A0S4JRY3_BODSA|nr:Hypothetical protein, putative [Bodo saltans]|eukprot:CUG92969.1 Hypothetical protein, putative [Bodo saltans]